MNKEISDNDIPLVVDLDGTLINTDLLHEALILLIKKNFLYFFICIGWLFKGKIYLKNKIFSQIHIPPHLLPYNITLLEFLKAEKNKGRKLILATASLKSQATNISKTHSLFNEVYGTESLNLKGKNKLEFLVKKFGKSKFDYIGNSNSDLIIFASCRYSYLVNPRKSLKKRTNEISDLQQIWNTKTDSFLNFVRAIRAYQWLKNLLIFIPLITSHSFNTIDFTQAFFGFLSFNFVASSGYLINDLLDLESDRTHLRKRNRPLASGELSISSGSILALILFAGGFMLASFQNFQFLLVLILYFIASFSYSMYFKKKALYDVFILALLYSIRVVAGAVIIDVSLSSWLIAFSTFLFLSLALVKRCSELIQVENTKSCINKGREYSIEDINLLQVMGIVSGFLSVIVFSLYIDSPEVIILYSRPKLLWIISFIFLFWISNIWLITAHGKMTDDPIIFAIKDKSSYFIFSLIGITLFFSI